MLIFSKIKPEKHIFESYYEVILCFRSRKQLNISLGIDNERLSKQLEILSDEDMFLSIGLLRQAK